MQVSTFADMEGEETFDQSLLGYADEVVEERISDDDVIFVKGTKTTSSVSADMLSYYVKRQTCSVIFFFHLLNFSSM